MNVTTLIAPTIEPVSLQDCYDHLRLTPEESPRTHPDDAMLLRQIRTARQDCENRTRRAFVKQKLRATLGPSDGLWPWPTYYRSWWGMGCRGIEIPRPPLIEISGISYIDSAGATIVVDPASYGVHISGDQPARLLFIDGFVAPDVYPHQDALRVDFWAGYPEQGSPLGQPDNDLVMAVPETIKAAILLGVELQYEALDPRQREMLEAAQENFLTPHTVLVAV